MQPPVASGVESADMQGCTTETGNVQDTSATEETMSGGEDSEGQSTSTVATPGERTAQSLVFLDRAPNWREMWNPRQSMSLTHTKGLLNAPGENNCFVNCAVQVLWHLDVFRRSFRLLSGHACMGNSCIFCALKVIFTQFQYSDQSSLPPDALRRALSKAFADQQRFQLGHMDDAAECFENILRRIHFHIANSESEDMCPAPHCISHQKFAMNLVEQVVCPCGATSEPLPFTQMVHYVTCSALVGHSKAMYHPGASSKSSNFFGQVLRAAASDGDMRNCPSNCGEKVQLRRTLTNSPDVVSIGLIWDSDRPSLQHITDVVCAIGTTMSLDEVFHSVVSPHPRHNKGAGPAAGSTSVLHLVGVVCYYGKHYSTFFFHSKMKKWVYFDDATVREMGQDFDAVADKCCRGHYQPLLLLYANSNASTINMETAPKVTTKLPGYQYFSQNNSGVPPSSSSQSNNNVNATSAQGQPSYNYETSLRNNIQYGRSVTPNPDSGTARHSTQARRAFTPGLEPREYDSDEDTGRFCNSDSAHVRQPSYINAIDNLPAPPQGQGQHGHPSITGAYFRGRSLQESKTRMVGGASSSSSLDDLTDSSQSTVKTSIDTPDYQDRTFSNNGPYRHQQNGGENERRASSSQFTQPAFLANTSTSHIKGHEIQRVESFNDKSGGRSGPGDAMRHLHGAKANVPRCIAREQRKMMYRHYGSTHDLASQDFQDSYSGGQDGEFKSNLKRTLSAENMDLISSNLSQPNMVGSSSHFQPVGMAPSQHGLGHMQDYGPGHHQRQRKSSLGTLLDQWGDCHANKGMQEGDLEGDSYISRKAVESILSKQKKTLPGKLPTKATLATGPALSSKSHTTYQQSLQVDIPDNESVGSRQDSGYRSNSSCGEHRNSASSISTASVDSPGMESNHGYPVPTLHNAYGQYRHPEASRDGYGRQQPHGRSADKPPLPNKLGTTNGKVYPNPTKEEDPYDYLPCHQPAHSRQGYNPGSTSQSKHPYRPPTSSYQPNSYASSSYQQHSGSSYQQKPLYSQSSSSHVNHTAQTRHHPVVHHSQQGNYTPSGGHQVHQLSHSQAEQQSNNKSHPNQSPGLLQQAMAMENLSSETKVYSRMKHNTCVLRSRSLQRKLLIRKDSVDSGADADQTSLSSMSTENDGRDLDSSNVEDEEYPVGSKSTNQNYLNEKLRKEAIYASQYSSDSGYSSHSSDYAAPSPLRHSQTDGALSTKCDDSYATLPRRGSQKAARSSSISGSSDTAVYQAYMHTNKAPHEPGHGLHRSDSLEHHQKVRGQAGAKGQNGKMSKDDIRQLLISDFVNKNKSKGEGQLQAELKDHLQQMQLQGRGAGAGSPDSMVCHSRDSSTSSTHTLKAHSRENSMSSQASTVTPTYPETVEAVHQPQIRRRSRSPPAIAPKPVRGGHVKKLTGLSSFVPTQEIELRTKNRRIQYVKPQTHPDEPQPPPPKPSEVVQLDQQNLQQHLLNQQQQLMSKLGAWDLGRTSGQVPSQSRPCSGEGLSAGTKHPQYWSNGPADWSDSSAGDVPPAEGTTTSETSSVSVEEDGLVDPDMLPPPPPSLMYPGCCTCDRVDGAHSPNCGVAGRESPELPPPPPEHILNDTCDDSNGNVTQRRHSAPSVPPLVSNSTETWTNIQEVAPKPPKSILKRTSKSGKSKKKSPMKKSISFSENIALIVCKDDAPEEIDYVAYVNSLSKQMKGAQSGQETGKKPTPENRTGYDSDFDDDTSDSVSSVDVGNDTPHCNLCQKKMVEALEVYCQDCHSYMARFQPCQGQS